MVVSKFTLMGLFKLITLVSVALIVPATLIKEAAVAVTPPLKALVLLKVKMPLLLNVLLPVMALLLPVRNTLYALPLAAAKVPVKVKLPWNAIVWLATVFVIATFTALTASLKVVPLLLVIVIVFNFFVPPTIPATVTLPAVFTFKLALLWLTSPSIVLLKLIGVAAAAPTVKVLVSTIVVVPKVI